MLDGVVMGQDIHNAQLEIFLVEQQVLVLAVNVYQVFAQFPHHGDGSRLVVDESSALAVRVDFPPDDAVHVVIVYVVVVEKSFHVIFRQVEMGFYDTFVMSRLDGLCVRSLPQQQCDGPQDDTLAGPRFARNDRKTGMELNVQFINEREVPDV